MDVVLVMFKADGTRKDFPIRKSRMVIGRMTGCDLRIPLPSISREHVEVIVDEDHGEVRMADLGSSNGTMVNGLKLKRTVLKAGDEMVVGPVVFTMQINGKPSNIRPVRTILETPEEKISKHKRLGTDDALGIDADMTRIGTMAGLSQVAADVKASPVQAADSEVTTPSKVDAVKSSVKSQVAASPICAEQLSASGTAAAEIIDDDELIAAPANDSGFVDLASAKEEFEAAVKMATVKPRVAAPEASDAFPADEFEGEASAGARTAAAAPSTADAGESSGEDFAFEFDDDADDSDELGGFNY